ncbi:MAG: putative sufE-like protein, partial [Chlamydiales bacterium]|nr:putative sufE-like protein [Chlamydiales bacterium]
EKIIALGRETPKLALDYQTEENLVRGCQSVMHLYSTLSEGKMHFEASSDALISFGLAVLLIKVYSGETPETVLKCPPTYLTELGIANSLTPNRANGLYSIHLKMKQDALKKLMGS